MDQQQSSSSRSKNNGDNNTDRSEAGGISKGSLADSPSKNNKNKQNNNNKEYRFPDGVNVPPSIDASLLQGDVVELLKQLPPDRINAALETYDFQHKIRGSEIRNPRAYLRGILKGSTAGRFGLPNGVLNIPPSISQSMLEDKDLMEVLKNMSAREINSCFRDFDEQIKKKSELIRNKSAYLMGIIRTGPHYNLPHGVILPPTVPLAMLQGELLELIQQLPAAQINMALGEYDQQIQWKGDTIRNKSGYLLGIAKRVKRSHDEETAAEQVVSQPPTPTQTQHPHQPGSSAQSSPNRADSSSFHYPAAGTPKNGGTKQLQQQQSACESPQGTLNLVTESFVNVTNELMIERKAKKDLEDQLKLEIKRREETNQRVLKFMSDLASEKEQRERLAMEVQRLKKDLTFERSLRETAEEKLQVLDEKRDADLSQQPQSKTASPGKEQDQLRKLELDLSIERGLREKTERLLQSAEQRIDELKQELQYSQQKLHEERTKSPFGDWISSPMNLSNGGTHSEDKKSPELPPSLTGISDLVSLTTFDPETFNFGKVEDIRIVNKNDQVGAADRLAADLSFLSKVYGADEMLVSQGVINRYLQLYFRQTKENVQVNLKLEIPCGFPDNGTLIIDATVASGPKVNESTQKFVDDSLPSLLNACRTEAQRSDALISVLMAADYWVQVDWFDKQLEHPLLNDTSSEKSIQICRLLLQTSYVGDVPSLKHMASKHGLGGCVKVGPPGLLLIEGLEENCYKFLESLNLRAKDTTEAEDISVKWSAYSVIGKALQSVEILKSNLLLPGKVARLNDKDAVEKLKGACQLVGLTEAVAKVMQ